jgi:polyhydroxybutyrate depolymerase
MGASPTASAIVSAGVAAFMTGCAASLPDRPTPEPGTYIQRLGQRVGGFRRQYRVHIPPAYDGRTELPLVVVLHGAFSTSRSIARRSGFTRLSDTEGFLVIYPDGYGFFDLLRHWNAGHCCGRARSKKIDDVGFLDAVIDDVERRLRVDRRRAYIVGESNGAMLAYLYAARRADRIAAAAAVVGTIGSRPSSAEPEQRIPPPSAPVPMLIIHGLDDQIVPFDGGRNARDPDRVWISVPRSAAFWVEHNRASDPPVVDELHSGHIRRSTWQPREGGAPVVLYALSGWGHDWPGPESVRQRAANDPLRGFDAAVVVWEFLASHALALEAPSQPRRIDPMGAEAP